MDEAYNGWANRETWAFYLHLSNDQGLWDWAGERVEDSLSVLAGDRDGVASVVGENMLESVQDLWDECEGSEWVRLMRSDVGSVWRIDAGEIGRHLVDDFGQGWNGGQ